MPSAPTLPKPLTKKEFVKHQEADVRAKLAALPIKYKDTKTIATVRHLIDDRLREAALRYEHNGNSSQVTKAYYLLEEELKKEIYKIAEGKTTKTKPKKEEDFGITRGGLGKTAEKVREGQKIKPKDQAAPLTDEQKAAQAVRNLADIDQRQAKQNFPGKVIPRGGDVGHGHVSKPTRMSSKQPPTPPTPRINPVNNKPVQITYPAKKPQPTKKGRLMGSKPPTPPVIKQQVKPALGGQKHKSSVANRPKQIVIPAKKPPQTDTSTGKITSKIVIPSGAPKTSAGKITNKIVIPSSIQPKSPASKTTTKIILPKPGITPPKPLPPQKPPIVDPSTKKVIPPPKVTTPLPSYPITTQSIITEEGSIDEATEAQMDRGALTDDRRERYIPGRNRDYEINDTDTNESKLQQSGGGGGNTFSPSGYDQGGGAPPNKRNNRKGYRNPNNDPVHFLRKSREARIALMVSRFIPPQIWVAIAIVAGVLLLVIIIIAMFAGGGNPPPPPPPPPACSAPPGGAAIGEQPTQYYMDKYGRTAAEVEANLVDINFQGHNVKVHRLVKPIFERVNNEITQANTGYAFRIVGTYNWRPKSTGGELSLHSFGISIDINPDTNPYHDSPAHDIPPAVADIFKRNGFGWGGDWKGAKDWMHFQYEGQPLPGPGGPAVGAPLPSTALSECGGAANENYVPPAPPESCGGKYSSTISKNNFLPMNYGDPQCNFDKDKLRDLLMRLENNNQEFVNYWFVIIIPGESGFNPNAWAQPAGLQAELDASGAWGLYQKGSSTPPGSPPPAPGKNGPLDRGDVNWEVQTANAINGNREAGCTFWYYGTFRKSPEGARGEIKRC